MKRLSRNPDERMRRAERDGDHARWLAEAIRSGQVLAPASEGTSEYPPDDDLPFIQQPYNYQRWARFLDNGVLAAKKRMWKIDDPIPSVAEDPTWGIAVFARIWEYPGNAWLLRTTHWWAGGGPDVAADQLVLGVPWPPPPGWWAHDEVQSSVRMTIAHLADALEQDGLATSGRSETRQRVLDQARWLRDLIHPRLDLPFRPNPSSDERLRRLEREADASSDPEAGRRLRAEELRAATHGGRPAASLLPWLIRAWWEQRYGPSTADFYWRNSSWYGPEQWRVRRENWGGDAALVMTAEGSFNYVLDYQEDNEGREAFTEWLRSLGWNWENYSGWAFGFYPAKNSNPSPDERRRRAARDSAAGLPGAQARLEAELRRQPLRQPTPITFGELVKLAQKRGYDPDQIADALVQLWQTLELDDMSDVSVLHPVQSETARYVLRGTEPGVLEVVEKNSLLGDWGEAWTVGSDRLVYFGVDPATLVPRGQARYLLKILGDDPDPPFAHGRATREEGWLSSLFRQCGLNADWNCQAWHLGPGPQPNRTWGDWYVLNHEEGGPHDRFLLVRRWPAEWDVAAEEPLPPEAGAHALPGSEPVASDGVEVVAAGSARHCVAKWRQLTDPAYASWGTELRKRSRRR